MRQIKRRMPAITLLGNQALNYALVFNKKGEILPMFGIVNLTISSDESTEDAPHASFLSRNNIIHGNAFLVPGMPPVSLLRRCNKKPRAQVSGISLLDAVGSYLMLQETLATCCGLYCFALQIYNKNRLETISVSRN